MVKHARLAGAPLMAALAESVWSFNLSEGQQGGDGEKTDKKNWREKKSFKKIIQEYYLPAIQQKNCIQVEWFKLKLDQDLREERNLGTGICVEAGKSL